MSLRSSTRLVWCLLSLYRMFSFSFLFFC
jgi:hypothetical protein